MFTDRQKLQWMWAKAAHVAWNKDSSYCATFSTSSEGDISFLNSKPHISPDAALAEAMVLHPVPGIVDEGELE